MDNSRFDAFTRTMSSRRVFSGAIAGTLAGLLGLTQAREAEAAPCPKGKRRCGKKCIPKRGCCKTADCEPKNSGQVCRRNRCACPGGMKRCGKRCLLKKAACPPKPDASCPAGTSLGLVTANLRLAQTFTEPNGGRLISAAFRMRNVSAATTGIYELRLQTVDPETGVPQATTLGVTQRSSDDVSDTTLEWVSFHFHSPQRLQPGRQYALVISLFGPGGWFADFRTGYPCPGGQLFTTNSSGVFTLFPNDGISYQTFVKP